MRGTPALSAAQRAAAERVLFGARFLAGFAQGRRLTAEYCVDIARRDLYERSAVMLDTCLAAVNHLRDDLRAEHDSRALTILKMRYRDHLPAGDVRNALHIGHTAYSEAVNRLLLCLLAYVDISEIDAAAIPAYVND